MGKTLFCLLLPAALAAPSAFAATPDRQVLQDEALIAQALSQPNPEFAEPRCLRRVARTGDHEALLEEGYRVSEIAIEPAIDMQGRAYYRISLTYRAETGEASSARGVIPDDSPAPVYSALRCLAAPS
jgi:hypothetical protein